MTDRGQVKVSEQLRRDTLSVDEGVVTLWWPPNISRASVEELREWLELALKRMETRANRAATFGATVPGKENEA